MLPLSVRQMMDIVQGTLLQGDLKGNVTGIAIDSREVQAGDLFVAFVGAQTDGHEYVASAFTLGAAAALVTKHIDLAQAGGNVIRVADALTAVQRLAAFVRTRFGGPVIAVTGSNGKTTTKDMLAAVFGVKGPCLATAANYNNELGLPLTLLGRHEEHQSIVLEMGMRGAGQIAKLAAIAQPTAGIITNIGQSHIELLGTQENIAEAKGELLEALPRQGVVVLNRDDEWLVRIADKARARVLWYQVEPTDAQAAHGQAVAGAPVTGDTATGTGRGGADATARDIVTNLEGVSFTAHVLGDSVQVKIPTHGRHNVMNALGALLLGAAHAIPLPAMADALANVQLTGGRLQLRQGADERTVVDDTYNSSPLSAKASLSALIDMAGTRPTVAVLGDMYELGDTTQEGHREVGQYAAERGVGQVITVGSYGAFIADGARTAGHPSVVHYANKAEAIAALPTVIPQGAVVLVKASRGMRLEDIVEALM